MSVQVILWNYPDRTGPPLRIDTMHDLNIFGVAFLPCTNSTHIVTSAFDRMVQLHRLDHSSMVPTAGRPRSDGEGAPPVATQAVRCHTTTYLNHSESVKVCLASLTCCSHIRPCLVHACLSHTISSMPCSVTCLPYIACSCAPDCCCTLLDAPSGVVPHMLQ